MTIPRRNEELKPCISCGIDTLDRGVMTDPICEACEKEHQATLDLLYPENR